MKDRSMLIWWANDSNLTTDVKNKRLQTKYKIMSIINEY